MDYAGRNAIVLGLGVTGLSMARHLVRHGARVQVADTRANPPGLSELKAELPAVPFGGGAFSAATFAGADLIAISPGVAKDQPAIVAALERGAELVGDIELFARALPPLQKVLAITGSNGKTTVTALTGTLCRAAGHDTVVAGNIGDAVLDALEPMLAQEHSRPWPDVFVLELSSFQLETTSTLRPVAAALLNLTQNHLDRYADMDAYTSAKARIFAGSGVQVINRDDARTLAMVQAGRIVESFGASVPTGEGEWGIVMHDGDAWLARGGELLLPTATMALLGTHNAQNALAALALTSTVARIDRKVLAALAQFRGLPHRMESVHAVDDIVYINDSKATTIAATQAALCGLARPVVLIAGGVGKGQDFAALRAVVATTCRAVLLIGRDAPQIARALHGVAVPVDIAGTLEAAVDRAIALAQPGDAVLLSPACASLDQFADYIERGERFTAHVRRHAPEAAHA